MPRLALLSHIALALLSASIATPLAAQQRPESTAASIEVSADALARAATRATGAANFVQNIEIDDNVVLPAPPPDDNADGAGRKWSKDYLALAAGVISTTSYNGSDDRILLPGFYLRGRLSGFSFSTRGTNLQVDLLRQRRGQKTDFKFGPLINLRGDRTGRIKDAQVEALGEKDLAVELGVSTGITHTGVITSKFDQIGFRLTGLYDVSGQHDSWVVSPTVEYGTPLSKRAYLGVSASMNIYGQGFGRYYFDVDPLGSAASGLPVYSGAGRRASVGKYTFGLAGAYALSGDLRKGFVLIGGAQYGRMTGRIARSPIVRIAGEADQWLAGAGLAYQF